jgi:hypothetical protein
MMGKAVKTITEPYAAQSTLTIPVADLLKGVYLVQLTFRKDYQALKFVKQ